MRRKSLMKEIICHRTIFLIILTSICVFIFIYSYRHYFIRIEAIEFTKKLGAGWNLGNTLDAHGRGEKSGTVEEFETLWHNPITTKQLFKTIKEAGFQTVRIPVTWYEHINADGTIDPVWLDRVGEIIDMAREQDLYVIINVHHDPWLDPGESNYENGIKMIGSVWRQIAEFFSSYDEHLIFEGMNEPRLLDSPDEWNEGTIFARQTINVYNEKFVRTVRATGGNNRTRFLMITPYCSSTEEEVIRDLNIPEDPRVLVSLHAYIPYQFALNEHGTSHWTKENEEDTEQIDLFFSLVEKYYISKRVPVVITEFGAMDKENLLERIAWLNYFKEKADQLNIPCIWWDEGSRADAIGNFQLLNRYTYKWIYPDIVKILTNS